MSQHKAFISAALETAQEFGITTEQLPVFEKTLLKKMDVKSVIKFVYTADFLRQFQARCTTIPLGLDENAPYFQKYSQDWHKGNRRYNEKPKVLVFSNVSLPEPSATAWTSTKFHKANQDLKIATLRKIGSNLNKMTKDNYEKMSNNILNALDLECVTDFILMILNKAVWDDSFRRMYADLCVKLMKKYGTVVFGEPLLKQCQKEFNKPRPVKPEPNDAEFNEYEYKLVKWKTRRMGGIYFIVELFKVRIVVPNIIYACLYSLLNHDLQEPNSENIQHAAELLSITHNKAESRITTPSVNRLREFMSATKLPTLVIFKIQDTLALFQAS